MFQYPCAFLHTECSNYHIYEPQNPLCENYLIGRKSSKHILENTIVIKIVIIITVVTIATTITSIY